MTVTVCAMFQLAAVKVRLAGATVPSVVSLEDRPMVTSAVGCGVEHDGEGGGAAGLGRDQPAGRVTVMPAVSLSVLVTRRRRRRGRCNCRRRWWPRR